MRRFVPVVITLLACTCAQAQTITKKTLVWQNVTRHYTVVVPPKNITLSGELIVTLHGTKYANAATPPDTNYYGWDYRCKQTGAGCIVVAAVSTWDPDATTKNSVGYWVWNAQFFDNMVFSMQPPPFTPYPDDIGFLRQLIAQIKIDYPVVNSKKIYVVGFSAGAFMAARVAVELSDLVAAVSINSGALQSTLGNPTVPNIPNPISILEYHGTLDNNAVGVDPCSATWDWNKFLPEKSTVDDTYNFFVSQNHCTVQSSALPLCQVIGGVKVFNPNDATSCNGNAEVKFTWEVGTAHSYLTSHDAADLLFFRAHAKP